MKTQSQKQEQQIAKMIGGRIQANSGGTRFGGGDVHTKNLFIEAKTPLSDKASFSIKKEWLDKAREQAFQQGKDYYALAFRFSPDEPDFFVIDRRLFRQLVKYLEEEE